MKITHCSQLGGIKSTPDFIYAPELNGEKGEGPLFTFGKYKYLLEETYSLQDIYKNRKGRVVFFSLEGMTVKKLISLLAPNGVRVKQNYND